MSVKRYTNGADDDQGTILPFMEESPTGDYVEYSDYARLKTEVERLTKAGDVMARLIQAIYEGEFSGRCEYEELKSWEAAKGVQS